MLTKVLSATTLGLDGVLIRVEVDVYKKGFPTFSIVGLPDKAVEESKERVRTAIKNSGFDMPEAKIVVNLAPADIPKEGAIFDLPIAIGILASSGNVESRLFNKMLFVGELSLDGKVQSVSGVLPIALMAKKKNIKNIFLPYNNAREAAFVKEVVAFPVYSISDCVMHLNGLKRIDPIPYISWQNMQNKDYVEVDFADIRGQEKAKRALEITAAGGHNIHMKGPPGAGKTMLAKAFAGIMPKMDEDDILEVSKIYSVAQLYKDSEFVIKRPFRAPHHTISRVGMIGGGAHVQPGEVSLAHRGVLFLDEFSEFPRSVLEALRQPIEDGVVTVTRASGSFKYPSRFILICASNPCPCGYLGHPKRSCKCTYAQILKYKKRLSGPILDRIDLHIEVPPVEISKLVFEDNSAEKSVSIRARVEEARARQICRFNNESIKTNAEMTPFHIKNYCKIKKEAELLLKNAISKFSLSARSYFKLIKVAQTIADLQNKQIITEQEILEAIQYRVEE